MFRDKLRISELQCIITPISSQTPITFIASTPFSTLNTQSINRPIGPDSESSFLREYQFTSQLDQARAHHQSGDPLKPNQLIRLNFDTPAANCTLIRHTQIIVHQMATIFLPSLLAYQDLLRPHFISQLQAIDWMPLDKLVLYALARLQGPNHSD